MLKTVVAPSNQKKINGTLWFRPMKCYNIKWSRAKEKDHLFFQLEESF